MILRLVLPLLATLALPAQTFDHTLWTRVLQQSVNEIGEIDYAKLKANPKELEEYVARLAATSPDSKPALFPTKADELAYWINAYNALCTYGVAKAYPVKSVRDLGFLFAFFRRADYTLGGKKFSLHVLEQELIRPRYREPRIHFALVCASLSCPKLSREAYTAANLESQLEFQTRQYFAENRNVAVDAKGNRVILAKILDWYAADFAPSALEYAKRHTSEAKRKQIESLRNPRVSYRDYDWSINDPGSRARAKTAEERELSRPPAS